MAKKYRIDDSFQMIGAFWLSDDPDTKFTGTLSARKGKVTIKSSPEYRKLEANWMKGGMKALSADQPFLLIPSICGFTSDNRCTLFASMALNNGGLMHFPTMEQIESKRYEAGRTVMGLHLQSADALAIDGAAIYLTKIQHLMPTPWQTQFESDKTSHEVPHQCLDVFSFSSTHLDADIECEVFGGGAWKLGKGTRLKAVPRIKISPRTPRSVNWFTSLAFRLENFFTLFLGTSVEIKNVQLFQGEEEGWVMQKVRPLREKVNLSLWVRCPYEMTSDALARWLVVPEDKRPVELTLLGMLRKGDVFDETRFLSLAQALEGFGRIRFQPSKGKKPTFAQFISKTYDLLTPTFAAELLGAKSDFVQKVVQTRNYYTHLGSPKGAAATQNGKELFLLNHRLNAFLRCVMLIDLGVAEDYVKQPILYQATRWR